MALAGRTWAQVASGLPSSPAAAPAPEPISVLKGAPEATANAACPDVPSKVGIDREAVQKVPQNRAAPGDVPAGPDTSAPTYEVAERTRAVAAPCAAAPAAVRAAISKDVVKSLGKRLQKDMAPVPLGPEGLLEAAQTAKFVAGAVSQSLVEDACQFPASDDLSSTAASDRERCTSCILCSGSGLLCVGLLKDPCPLCEPEGDIIGDERPEALSQSAVSDWPSEFEQADSSCSEVAIACVQVVPKPATGMCAPPGIGPPGVWVWPEEADRVPSDDEENTVVWPAYPVDSVEVEFIGKVAQHCFGSDFLKMIVSWDEPWVQGESTMPKASVQLHLGPMAPVYLDFLAPLSRLQSLLARDQACHQCQIFCMGLSKDFATMDLSCAMVTSATCWDVLKKGYCPRPGCTWPHPAPTLVNVSWTGGPELYLVSEDEKVQNRPRLPLSIQQFDENNATAQFNLGAYSSSDDSSDDM